MALANFFGRTAQSIAQLTKAASTSDLQSILSDAVIEIAYDSAGETTELDKALDLLIRLLARLYPKLRLSSLGAVNLNNRLQRLARSINPVIEFTNATPSITLLLGPKSIKRSCPIICLGSEGWVARVSRLGPLSFGSSPHAFGAGAAACLGAANVFRHTFSGMLPAASQLDKDVELCLLDYCEAPSHSPAEASEIEMSRVHLVGAGAIGNAAIWALTRSAVSAEIVVVDHELVELSNLQRYVLTTQRHVGKPKTEVVKAAAKDTGVRVLPKSVKWGEFAETSNFQFDKVLTALDSADDRIAVQASLPRWVANAWTQSGDLGVSRHRFLGEQACLACLYWPTRSVPSLDEVVASALRMTDQLMRVREMLYAGEPVGAAFVFEVAARYSVDPQILMPFAGARLMEFYQRAICGGLVLEITASTGRDIEVPLVFQSALAGVMLAAEAASEAIGSRPANFPSKTVVDVTRPIAKRLSTRMKKTPGCICEDPDFVARYHSKYALCDPI